MARNKGFHARPTGQVRQTHVDLYKGKVGEISAVSSFSWPPVKEDAETLVIEKFWSVSHRAPWMPLWLRVTHYPDPDGPDFFVETPNGTEYVELVEIALLRGPYQTAQRTRSFGEFLNHCVDQVLKKQKKYHGRGFSPLTLLVYVGDDAFLPNEEQTAALRVAISKLNLSAFKEVFLILFASDGTPWAFTCAPPLPSITKRRLRELQASQMVCADPRQRKVVAGGVGKDGKVDVTVRQYLPPGTELSDLATLEKIASSIPIRFKE
jgi:hypothetical protein